MRVIRFIVNRNEKVRFTNVWVNGHIRGKNA